MSVFLKSSLEFTVGIVASIKKEVGMEDSIRIYLLWKTLSWMEIIALVILAITAVVEGIILVAEKYLLEKRIISSEKVLVYVFWIQVASLVGYAHATWHNEAGYVDYLFNPIIFLITFMFIGIRMGLSIKNQ